MNLFSTRNSEKLIFTHFMDSGSLNSKTKILYLEGYKCVRNVEESISFK